MKMLIETSRIFSAKSFYWNPNSDGIRLIDMQNNSFLAPIIPIAFKFVARFLAAKCDQFHCF